MDALQTLAEAFTAKKPNKEKIVERIFDWITSNISYDVDSFKDQTSCSCDEDTNDFLNEILESRKTLCVGYSCLFQEFCRLCEIECVRVSGFCKGYDYHPGNELKNTEPNHQWNCVNLDGVWRLVDCCWGAGYIDETSAEFIKAQRNLYCLTDPTVFILDHFPCDSKWQLLSSPIDLETFERTANVKHGFTMYKVQLCNQKEALITCKEECNVQLSFPKPLDISYRLLDKSQIITDACVDYHLQRNHVSIQCTLPYSGTFTLNVYGKERDNKDATFKGIVSYAISNISESGGCGLGQPLGFRHSLGPSPKFYEMQLQQCLPIRTTLSSFDTSGELLSLSYLCSNHHFQLKADLYRIDTIGQTKLNNLTLTNRKTNRERQILVNVPGSGDFLLKVYGRINCNAGFQQVASYRVTGSMASSGLQTFPQMTPRWLQRECTLISPLSGILTTDETVHFQFAAVDATEVFLLLPGKKNVRLKSIGDDAWETTCNVGSREGDAQIFVKSRTDNCYNKYLQYFVQKPKP